MNSGYRLIRLSKLVLLRAVSARGARFIVIVGMLLWYLDEGLAGFVKEPRPTLDSPIAGLIVQGVKKVLLSAMFSKLLPESKAMQTHPFVQRLQGRGWVSAHNGDVSEMTSRPEYSLKHCKLVGSTEV